MLDQHHFEQHHWIYAWPAIVLAVQGLHYFIQTAEIHCPVYLPQKMLLWYQAVYPHDLYHIPVYFPTFQQLSHHLLLFYLLQTKKPG